MTLLQQADALLLELDRAEQTRTDEEKARAEREQRVKDGKARQVVWLMKQEGMTR